MPDLNMPAFVKKYSGYIALGIFVVIVFSMFAEVVHVRENYRVVCLGDSIIGNVRDETAIPAVVEQLTGKKVLNGGFGGMSLAYSNEEKRSDVQEDCFSLIAVSEAMVSGDFSWQNGSMASAPSLEYFADSIADFESADWNDVEVIVIEYGVNDYLSGIPLDNESMPYDKYTYGGALRYVLALLQEKWGEKRIILCTPTFCWFPEEDADCGRSNGYGSLQDYVNLEKEIAEEFGVEVLDNFYESGIGAKNQLWSEYTIDGLHLNATGRKLIAKRIAECIEK